MGNHGTDASQRFGVMRERIEAMKAIWTEDEASYRGRYVNFERIWCWPKPVQKPHPPVLVGRQRAAGARSRARLRRRVDAQPDVRRGPGGADRRARCPRLRGRSRADPGHGRRLPCGRRRGSSDSARSASTASCSGSRRRARMRSNSGFDRYVAAVVGVPGLQVAAGGRAGRGRASPSPASTSRSRSRPSRGRCTGRSTRAGLARRPRP